MTETAKAASVVLPGATPLETCGTYISCDGKERSLARIQEPLSGFDNLQVISALTGAVGVNYSVDCKDKEGAPSQVQLVLPEEGKLFKKVAVIDPALRIFQKRLAV